MNFRKTTLAIVCMVAFVGFAQAQTTDEVINKYVEATGGKAKWESVKTLSAVGKRSGNGMEFPVVFKQKTPNSMRMEMTFQGKTMVQAVDGKNGDVWGIMPFRGTGEPEKVPAEMAKVMLESASFEPKFVNYATKGHTATLEGKETIEGVECHKLKLVTKGGNTEYHFFDTENGVTIMERSIVSIGPNKGEAEDKFFSDYKDVSGLMFPHVIETKFKGQSAGSIVIESIKINEDLDNKIFEFPKK